MVRRVLIDGTPFVMKQRSQREISLRPLRDDHCCE
jgi:hypothetical protein